jgi:protein ImuB
MSPRRILSLWFPRLAAERLQRAERRALPLPLAVVADQNGAQVLTALTAEAEAAGLSRGMGLRDATAICPALVTRPADPLAEAAFLATLRRWAGRFSPWVAEEPPDSLVIDLTGCAHLFGGEMGLLAEVEADCARLGLTLRAGLADTPGAAWALARYAGRQAEPPRSGDDIAADARATRSRAARRRGWERGGDAPGQGPARTPLPQGVTAAPGQTRAAIGGLPLAALRLPPDTVEGLSRLGLRRVEDLALVPRAPLVRRFGRQVMRRLDQALGHEAEPVGPAREDLHFAARLTLPDPIGLLEDVQAGVDRILPVLCARLAAQGHGARRLRLEAFRCDGRVERAEVGFARPAADPATMQGLIALKLPGLDAGPGIDRLRIEATQTEPLHQGRHPGPRLDGGTAAGPRTAALALEDLIGRLGARLGMESVTRLHPADTHIPEKSAQVQMAAWSAPAPAPWPAPRAPRPLLLFRPEAVEAPESPALPDRFRWRRRDLTVARATGPERLAPEWWLDDPAWRSGPRDYWRVQTAEGDRLWLFYAHGAEMSGGWFCQGSFA